MYSTRYSPYFVDLRKWLPQNHIDLYSSGLASQTCKYNDKWVGLVTNNYIYIYLKIKKKKKKKKKKGKKKKKKKIKKKNG